jgi:hypothetical protein
MWSDTRCLFIIPDHPLFWTSSFALTSCLLPQQDNLIFQTSYRFSTYPRNEKSRTIPSISSFPSMPMLLELSAGQVFAKNTIWFPRIFKAPPKQKAQVDVSNDMSEMRGNQSGSKLRTHLRAKRKFYIHRSGCLCWNPRKMNFGVPSLALLTVLGCNLEDAQVSLESLSIR